MGILALKRLRRKQSSNTTLAKANPLFFGSPLLTTPQHDKKPDKSFRRTGQPNVFSLGSFVTDECILFATVFPVNGGFLPPKRKP